MPTFISRLSIAAILALSLAACDSEPSGTSATVDSNASSPAEVTNSAEPEPPIEDEPEENEPEPEPTPEGPTVAQIGEVLEVVEGDKALGSITIAAVETSDRPFSSYGEGPSNGTFVTFSVDVSAQATFDVYDGDFYVLADDGTRYDVGDGNAMDAVDYDDTLGWVELNAGEKKSGLLAFDLPAEHGRLAYAPNYDGGPIGVWEF